ncbi:membrane spanning protein [Gloeomargarita lithophora Alchichica-D10]|uniref:Membrane spanning protein n=1 Tax=Gloeomargarita lithophora Alchichica-D10 TaxID=1188229 RepID=A0A1J0A9M1_9CYAN|nr:manganese efflux pump [Gloeomargarita lithophora]APB32613.1 membrane spanning protein [Gloeomargarita lithophora Alchichica-D10]
MMNGVQVVFTYLLLGVATNIDNLIIGTTYGLRRKRINFLGNLTIAVFNALATFLSVLAGDFLRRFLSESIGELLGGLAFLVLGILTILEAYLAERAVEEQGESFSPQAALVRTPYREIVAVGLGTAVSNLAGGVGAGLAGFDPVRMTVLMFVFSLLPISLGQWVGQHTAAKFPQQWANITAATVLMGFGVWKLVSGATSIGG